MNPKDGLTYLWIPPGNYTAGCSPNDKQCFPDETPNRKTTLTKGFWLSRTEVTQAAFEHVMGYNPSVFQGADLPVEYVSWDEADEYCSAIGGRLPSEAEWEYAARAGTTGSRYGNLDEIAWYEGNAGLSTHPVGKKKPNAFGLYDMLGNVVEWTHTFYWVQHNQENINPTGPSIAEYVELRGGGWWDEAKINSRVVPQALRKDRYRLQHRLPLHFGVSPWSRVFNLRADLQSALCAGLRNPRAAATAPQIKKAGHPVKDDLPFALDLHYRASGLGRIWNFTILPFVPFPPSICQTKCVP